DMLMDCKVPFGSGLSSSAAIEVSTLAALRTLTEEPVTDVEIALLAQRAEREYVGMNCGIMDQYASACGKENKAMLLDCKTIQCEYIPMELGEYSLVIIDCRKPHNLVESKYNERRAETEQALQTLKKYNADITCLADLTPEAFRKTEHALSGKVRDRAQHVVQECDRVRLAVQCMKEGRIDILGMLLNESHASLSRLYEVTGRELDALASIAQSHPACIGSRMTGAGFGGCTISLVRKDAVQDFVSYTLSKYTEETGYEAKFYEAGISDGITVEKL
ncbi:MAG: galactokinase, partial [Clostridia bacterium]|nr:galactokinase [Clostridia bacterium]